MSKCFKILFIIFIIIFTSLTFNKTYAISTKEEVEEYKEYEEEYVKSETKKNVFVRPWGHGLTLSENPSDFLLYDIAVNAFEKYLNKYLENDIPENEKIIDYIMISPWIFTRKNEYNDGDDIEAKVEAYVFPESEKSIWAKEGKLNSFTYFNIFKYKNREDIVEQKIEGYLIEKYIRLVKENDEYVIKFMDIRPEGYAEFVERVKEKTGLDLDNINYADFTHAKSKTEIRKEVAEKEEFESRQEIIEENIQDRISIIITTICILLIFLIILSYIKYLKIRKNNIP